MNCTDFFTDLMDSYGFCSQSLQVWSTQGWQVWYDLDCQKRSRSGLCSKLPEMRSVSDIALNPSVRKSKRE